jgi:glycosyltransferase involved in cell wall biosynthesis
MIVIIPCWRRPAHLAATLRCIERARGFDEHSYLIAVDKEPDDAIYDVAFTFKAENQVIVNNHDKLGNGPAHNILRAWRKALSLVWDRTDDPWIGLIEEDILVAEDLFEFWTEALERDFLAVGVSACNNQNRSLIGVVEPPWTAEVRASGIYQHPSYQSLAVALRPGFVRQVLKHMVPSYFENPFVYCNTHLPDDGLPNTAVSQDGLFHRVLRRHGDHLLYPLEPRGFHAGWYGYNRRSGVALAPGDWKANSECILQMTPDQMNELADERFRDIRGCSLIRARTNLRLV